MPLLTAVIPLERDDHSLIAALDAFLGQSIPSADLEIVFVIPKGRGRPPTLDRHRALKRRAVAWPAGGHLADALNAGANAARADVLVFLRDVWRPMPGCADYCLEFHARQPGLADTLALGHAIDPTLAADPLLWWLGEQALFGLDTLSSGIHNWRALRFDALSVKRALLRQHPIPSACGDERLMGTAWARRVPVRVFAEPVPVVLTADRPRLPRVMSLEYRAAFARCKAMAASPQDFTGEILDARFEHPERFILETTDQAALAETITEMERELAGRHPRFAVGGDAEQCELLGKLYLAAVSHARSAGWADAKAGKRRGAGEDRCRRFPNP